MVTAAQARKIFLALPHAEERSHMGHPDFRVGGKIFATLWNDGETAVLKLPAADQTAITQMDPEAFSLGGWAKQGFTKVSLKRVTTARLRSAAQVAWRHVAPKKVLAEAGQA